MMLPLPYPHASARTAGGFSVIATDGAVWCCTTDGHSLAARRVASAPWEHNLGRQATVRAALDAVTSPVDLEALHRFLGEPKFAAEVTCPSCEGTGRHYDADAYCLCSRCVCERCQNGKVIRRPDQRTVILHGLPFDANIVGAALHLCGAAGSAMWGLSVGPAPGLAIRTTEWLALAMPLSLFDKRTHSTYPVFT